MANRQYSDIVAQLDAHEYVRIFKEAYDLRMPPCDFRVWDAFLFSRCSDADKAFDLLMLFDWPILYLPGSHDENIRTVVEWCINGTFVDEAKKVIETVTDDRVSFDFLEKNQAMFRAGPLGLSEVRSVERDAWFDQAKVCIKATSPNATTPETVKTVMWYEEQKRQEAYFAFGVIVWLQRPEPHWVMENARLDVWYKLGFAVALQPTDRHELFLQYRMCYSAECGISATDFETFFHCLSNGLMFNQLTTGWDSMKPELRGDLEIFLTNMIHRQQDKENVLRLHQWTLLSNQDVLKMEESNDWGVFGRARANFALTQLNDEKGVDVILRRFVWADVLNSYNSPHDFYVQIRSHGLRQFLKGWYAKYGRDTSTLNRLFYEVPSRTL